MPGFLRPFFRSIFTMSKNDYSYEEDETEGSLEWYELVVGWMDEKEEELTPEPRYVYG